MNTTLWIVQAILAGMFAMAGFMKLTKSTDQLLKSGLNWVERLPLSTVRLIGLFELLGAFGLILPWALGIFPILTSVAAVLLTVVMLLAAIHHIQHNEKKAIVFNALLGLMALFVAYGRFVVS